MGMVRSRDHSDHCRVDELGCQQPPGGESTRAKKARRKVRGLLASQEEELDPGAERVPGAKRAEVIALL